MRIISGTHGRRKIDPPDNLPVRPTTDLAKGGLFNIINNNFDFAGLKVLDLFSGTGNISFEFTSRGADEVISVDENYKCISFIKETSEKFNFSTIKAIKSDAFHFLGNCNQTFDIIFSDPPFEMAGIEKIHEIIFQKKMLNEMGWFVLEHSSKNNFSKLNHYFDCRKYGDVHFSFFKLPVK